MNSSKYSSYVFPPDDFVAGATYGGPPAVLGCLLRRLHNGAPVFHGRGLDRLLVLGHNSAGFVRVKTVSKMGVCDPRRSTGWGGTACSCSLGAWARKTKGDVFTVLAKTWL